MQDGRTQMLFAAIVIDVITGTMCAIRSGKFDFVRFGQFYRTNVLPFVLGWLMIYGFSYLSLTSLVGETWTNIVAYAGYVPALVALGKSIQENLTGLQNPNPIATQVNIVTANETPQIDVTSNEGGTTRVQ
jgi:hypothetical protein